MLRINGVADPAFHVDTRDQRIHEITARDRPMLAESQDRGDDRAGRMNDVSRMGIVVVQNMRADAVDQSGVQDIEPLLSSEDARLCGPRKRCERRHRNVDGFMMRTANRASNPVEQGARRFLANGWRQICKLRGDDVSR